MPTSLGVLLMTVLGSPSASYSSSDDMASKHLAHVRGILSRLEIAHLLAYHNRDC